VNKLILTIRRIMLPPQGEVTWGTIAAWIVFFFAALAVWVGFSQFVAWLM
jgi:hypothetical protein